MSKGIQPYGGNGSVSGLLGDVQPRSLRFALLESNFDRLLALRHDLTGNTASGRLTAAEPSWRDRFAHAIAEQSGATPEIRRVALDRFEQDAALSARMGAPVRQDIQMARWIFAHSGFKGLRDALGKGILPAAAVAVFLGYEHDERT